VWVKSREDDSTSREESESTKKQCTTADRMRRADAAEDLRFSEFYFAWTMESFTREAEKLGSLQHTDVRRDVLSSVGAMSDPSAKKILIAGDVRGNVAALYKRVASVNASAAGPFHALFCVGPFFGDVNDAAAESGDGANPTDMDELRPYIDGTAVAPVPTYFIDALPGGRKHCRHPEGVVAPNITFLRSPAVRDIAGLRVAALPGHHNPLSYDDESKLATSAAVAEGEYRPEDVKALRASHASSGGGVVDLLLTADWPVGITAFARVGKDDSTISRARTASASGSHACAELARDLQPRYHVAGGGANASEPIFYAREPYRNPRGHVTRFVGLGAVGNPHKQKWMHALALTPAETMPPSALTQQPVDTTASPYAVPPGPPGGALPGPPTIAGSGGSRAKRRVAADAGANDFDHGALRWEDPKAKRLKHASEVDRRPLRGDIDKTVYARNLAFRADEGAIGEFFGQCGEIVDLRVGRDDQGRSRGFCRVAFSSAEAAERALGLTDANFYGRNVVVAMAKSDEQRNAERDERRRDRPPATPPTGCWFCLSNEKDTHLVASIASESFVSLDKGGIVPDHCQVVPVEHTPSFCSMTPSAAEEVWLYLRGIRKCLASGGGGFPERAADGGLPEPRDLVVFERHLALRGKGGNHCHMNCVPIPRSKSGKARKIFEQAATRLNFEWTVLEKPKNASELQLGLASVAGDGEYFAVHLPCGSVFARKIQPREPHWMSFGREVLGHLLGCPERASWQNCMESESEETRRAELFKKSFEPFDEPNLNA